MSAPEEVTRAPSRDEFHTVLIRREYPGKRAVLQAAYDALVADRDRWNKLSLETSSELARALGPYRDVDELVADRDRLAAELAEARDSAGMYARYLHDAEAERDALAREVDELRAALEPTRETHDYLTRTIETIRNHRDADNCWPQWANHLSDEIERMWGVLVQPRSASPDPTAKPGSARKSPGAEPCEFCGDGPCPNECDPGCSPDPVSE